MLLRRYYALLAVVVFGFAATTAGAQTTFTFDTPVGATWGGEAVDASAKFVISGNTITITLTNLEPNPVSVAQALRGIDFNLSSGSTWAFVDSSSADRVRISGNQSYTLEGAEGTGWRVSETFNGGIQLAASNWRGGDLLIGPPGGSTYSDANRSITGKHHDVFLDQTATFILTIPCLKGFPAVTGVTFLFGRDGRSSPDCMRGGKGVAGDPAVTPEPTTMLLFGSGLAALGAFRRKLRLSA